MLWMEDAVKSVGEVQKAGIIPLAVEYMDRAISVGTAEHIERTWPMKDEGKVDLLYLVEEATEDYLALEPNSITFHYEACKNKEEVWKYINKIKQNNCKVGLSIKPETNVEEIYEFLPYIHTCLIMTVEPGKGGQTLLGDMVDKIKTLKSYIDKNDIEIDIEADGGINLKTAESVAKAGANILVSGTAILIAKDYKVIIDELKNSDQ